jgi:hypothetical protein
VALDEDGLNFTQGEDAQEGESRVQMLIGLDQGDDEHQCGGDETPKRRRNREKKMKAGQPAGVSVHQLADAREIPR